MSVIYISHVPETLTAINNAKKRALEICGATAERYAKENLTKNHSVDTGNLRNSITHDQLDEDTEVIGTAVKYSVYVELGHHQEPGRYVPQIGKRLVRSFVPGKPYLRPAAENHVEEYKEIIKREFENA